MVISIDGRRLPSETAAESEQVDHSRSHHDRGVIASAMMRRSVVLLSLISCDVAWADKTTPGADRWIERCTKALDDARDEAARRKLPVRNDKVSEQVRDGDVRLSLTFDTEGPYVLAGAILAKAESPAQGWTKVSDARWPLHWYRRQGRVLLELFADGPPRLTEAYDKIFRPALERCLEPTPKQ